MGSTNPKPMLEFLLNPTVVAIIIAAAFLIFLTVFLFSKARNQDDADAELLQEESMPKKGVNGATRLQYEMIRRGYPFRRRASRSFLHRLL